MARKTMVTMTMTMMVHTVIGDLTCPGGKIDTSKACCLLPC